MELLAEDLEDARVLDLFAGTGAVGLEALSRGAGSADFVENHPSALHALKANVAAMRSPGRIRVFKKDVLAFLERVQPDTYDVAFADPPYASTLAERVVKIWLEAPFSSVLAVEHDATRPLPGRGHGHAVGDSAITIFRASGTGR
jgi:16S rRNA (guanine966-N2)-methyltransferase